MKRLVILIRDRDGAFVPIYTHRIRAMGDPRSYYRAALVCGELLIFSENQDFTHRSNAFCPPIFIVFFTSGIVL